MGPSNVGKGVGVKVNTGTLNEIIPLLLTCKRELKTLIHIANAFCYFGEMYSYSNTCVCLVVVVACALA